MVSLHLSPLLESIILDYLLDCTYNAPMDFRCLLLRIKPHTPLIAVAFSSVLLCLILSLIRISTPISPVTGPMAGGQWLDADAHVSMGSDPLPADATGVRIWVDQIRGMPEFLEIRFIPEPIFPVTGISPTLIPFKHIQKVTRETISLSYIDVPLPGEFTGHRPDRFSVRIVLTCMGDQGSALHFPVIETHGGNRIKTRFLATQSILKTAGRFMDSAAGDGTGMASPIFLLFLIAGWLISAVMVIKPIFTGERSRGLMVAILSLLLFKGFLLAIILPLWSGPDEPFHFDRIRGLLQGRGWVGYDTLTLDAEVDYALMWQGKHVGDSFYRNPGRLPFDQTPLAPPFPLRGGISQTLNYQEKHPFLYYGLMAPIPGIMHNLDIVTQVQVIRILNVIMAGLICWLGWRTARSVYPDRPDLVAAVPVLIAGYTVFSVNTATINNDNLLVLLAAIFVERLCARHPENGLTLPRTAVLGVIAGLALLTKSSGIALLLAGIPALVILAGKERFYRITVFRLGLFSGTAVLISGGWYLFQMLSRDASQFIGYQLQRDTLSVPVLKFLFTELPGSDGSFPELFFVTFFSSLSWNFIRYHLVMYVPYGLLTVGATIGLIRTLTTRSADDEAHRRKVILLTFLVMVAVSWCLITIFVYTTTCTTGRLRAVHGRYYYIFLTAIAIMAVRGISAIPGLNRMRVRLLPAVCTVWLILDGIIIWRYLIPWFHI